MCQPAIAAMDRLLRLGSPILGLAVALLLPHATRAAPRLGWTAPKVVISEPHADARGYAMTAFENRAYVVDLTDAHEGGKNTSQIWFSTDRTGKWQRQLVAAVPDDPGADGASAPQIAVLPASGDAVIAVVDGTANGSHLLTYSNQSGHWQPVSMPEGTGADAFHNETAPSLATHGNTVALAFNASYVASTSACSQVEGNVFLSTLTSGQAAWVAPQNVTEDYCQPSLFAKYPLLAYGPSGTLFMLYQRSGDANALNQLAIRSGTLAAGTEQIIEPAPATGDWGLNGQPGFYDLIVDGHGAPQVVYWLGGGSSAIPPRIVYATQTDGKWQRTVLHQAAKPGDGGDAAQMAPAIASGDSGITVAYTGAYNSDSSANQAAYWMNSDGGPWSGPANITRSKHSDTAPALAVSEGLKHLFMLRDGDAYIYSHELPYPDIVQHQAGAGNTLDVSGSVSPSSAPEAVHVCLQRKLSATRWSACQGGEAKTQLQGKTGVFGHRLSGLAPGDYRFHVTVNETDDHLAGTSDWLTLTVH